MYYYNFIVDVVNPLLSSTFFFKILYPLQWILKISVKDMFILSSWLRKSNLLNTFKVISPPFLWLCFSIECDRLLWNICVCLLNILFLSSIVLSRIVFNHLYWWRNHFTIVCLRYFRIWRRGQKECAIWEKIVCFVLWFCFLKYTRFSLYALFFSGGSTNWKGTWGSPRSWWKNHCANKVTYWIHLNEAL